jgi:hypothetical protein
MERSMALWKMEYDSERKLVVDEPFRFLDLVGLIAIATAPALVLLLLIPLPLVPPVLSILSFVIACGVALSQRRAATARRGDLGYRRRLHLHLDRHRDDEQSQALARLVRQSFDGPLKQRV